MKIKLEDLYIGYQNLYQFNLVIKGLSLLFEAGKVYGIVGVSGTGKSTILKAITNQIKLLSGKIEFENVSQTDLLMISQEPEKNLVLDLTINQYQQLLPSAYRKRFEEYLLKLNLSERRNGSIKTLSGGELQRFVLAITLCQEPKVLILDEPTSKLNYDLALDVIKIIKEYCVEKNAIGIVTTHNPTIAKMLDVTAVVEGGQIVHYGKFSNEMMMSDMKSQTYNGIFMGITPKIPLPVQIIEDLPDMAPTMLSLSQNELRIRFGGQ
ncbi:MAG: ABC transporter ATP-binding protein [Methanobacteriota archaeon]|nr:MAG: ABC transporter ATP-binding protein [Euryarchaeota archaeon]